MTTLSIPNVTDSYAQGITGLFQGKSREGWLTGCARSSGVGLLWGQGDRVVLMPAPWEPAVVSDLEQAFGRRWRVHRVPEDLGTTDSDLDRLAGHLREIDEGIGFTVRAWSPTHALRSLVDSLADRGVRLHADSDLVTDHWSRLHLDSKIGLRQFIGSAGLADAARLPEGVVCTHVAQACEAAVAMLGAGHERVVLKADRGAGGFGHFSLDRQLLDWPAVRRADVPRLVALLTPMLRSSSMVVEAWLPHSHRPHATPSAFVRVGEHSVSVVGTAATFVEEGRYHLGAVVATGALPSSVEAEVHTVSRRIASSAQALGYRGWLGLDFVVDEREQLHLVEVNPRRTMVSHCHDLRAEVFGADTGEGGVASCEGIVLPAEIRAHRQVRSLLRASWYDPARRHGLLISHFVPPSGSGAPARLSLMAIGGDARVVGSMLRRALDEQLGVLPPSIDEAWSRLGCEEDAGT